MAYILFDSDGKKIGEISEWKHEVAPPAYKTFLGKTVLMAPANDECTFVSPKPVRRKAVLTIVADAKTRYVVEVTAAIGGTQITAKIKEQTTV